MWVMDARIEALNRISADQESTIDKCVDKGSESGGSDYKHLKREKMQDPKFSVDIWLFAPFRSNFEKIVAPTCPDKCQQAYIIKRSCLQGECKKLVENLSDIDKIWETLEVNVVL